MRLRGKRVSEFIIGEKGGIEKLHHGASRPADSYLHRGDAEELPALVGELKELLPQAFVFGIDFGDGMVIWRAVDVVRLVRGGRGKGLVPPLLGEVGELDCRAMGGVSIQPHVEGADPVLIKEMDFNILGYGFHESLARSRKTDSGTGSLRGKW